MNFPLPYRVVSSVLCLTTVVWTTHICSTRNSSRDSAELPKKNFTATIEGSDGLSYVADHIAIGSRSSTEHIVVYHAPKEPGARPGDYATYLDLGNITEIVTVFPSEKERTIAYDTTEYVPITVTFHDGSKKHQYLIEARKELFCDEVDGAQYIPHALKFTAVKRITLKGTRCTTKTHPVAPSCEPISEQERRKHTQCSHAGKAIDTLTQQVETLPTEQKGKLRAMVDTVRDYVGAMCSTE